MGISRRRFVGLGAAAGLAPHAHAILQPGPHDADDARSDLISDSVDWAEFLSRHDLLWDQIPHQWGDAPFLGNGRLAISVRGEPDDTTPLWFSIDNSDVYDRRDESWGWTAYSQSRYHVGDLLLKPVGQLLGLQMRLSLYDGELTGTVTTSAGTIAFVAFVHPQRMVGVVNLTPSEGEQSCRWDWRAGEAVSSRTPIRNAVQQAQYQKSYGHPVKLWVDNPAAERSQSGGVDLCVQKLLAHGAYATAWKETQSSEQERTTFASCVMSWPGLESSQDSLSEVRSALAAGFQSLRDSNRLWWHTYYPASFLSIPDTQLESFYWIQMYKYGCAAPKQPGIIDTHGPWLQPTNWPYITWNLNTQISYWALQPANRLKLADSLFRSLDAHPRVMSQNVAGFTTGDDLAALGHCSQQDLLAPFDADVRFEREWGNLLWVCHNYWLQYRFTMDDALLRHRLFPLLRRAVNFYLPHLEEGSDGKLHLPITFSPEIGSTRDCNYDLALLRWACQTLLTICARLHVEDARAIRWREVVSRLTSYPVDEHGLRIGADLSAAPHRHFSHLLMIYPLYLMNWDEPSSRELIKKSVEYWYSATRTGKSDAGFTLAVGSSFYASMQRGDDALACLDGLLNGPTGMGKIMSNTMYAESGQNMETPLAAAQAYHDMLLQSWGDRIRVFPAVPAKWKYLVFHNLRAQGAFLVSASMKDGRASWVRVKSLSGERCIIQCAFGAKPVAFRQRGTIDLRVLNPDSYEVRLRRGEEVLLHAPSFSGRPVVSPVPAQPHRSNYYGLHRRQT